MSIKLLALGGDGIGPEVVNAALKVLDIVGKSLGLKIDLSEDLLHGAAWEKYGQFCRLETLDKARHSDAILVGAVGGEQWDNIVIEGGPAEQDGLMKLRQELDVYAGLRPARCWNALIPKTPYRPECIQGADIMVMREMCGGAFFSQTRGIESLADGGRRAYDLNEYSSGEIERFARASYDDARRRGSRVVSVDKSNVVVVGELWREVVEEIGKAEYPDVELTHYYADNAAYQLGRNPTAFDVIMGDNLFGDIISDQAGAIAGSLGMLPSASLPGFQGPGKLLGPGIYEPVHDTAPDIAGQNIANPIGMILSIGMMLEYSFGYGDAARKIEAAVEACLEQGIATLDIGGTAGTDTMTDAVIRHYRTL
jgi:3-isopropylmalate dehydrogenase